MKQAPWMTTYPTVAAVQAANVDTLCAWWENLPAPQTDVERTVYRRIRRALDERVAKDAPEVHAGIQKLRATMKAAGIRMPGNFYSP